MHPLLRGLFGVLQSAAQARASTANVWAALREGAASAFNRIRGVPNPQLPADLQAQGRAILSEQGVGIRQVNQARGLAGQWLRARQHLNRLPEGAQLTAASIFTPPWAKTAVSGVQTQFRARVQFNATGPDGTPFSAWRTIDLGSQLATRGDILDRARALFPVQGNSDIPPGSTLQSISGLTLEAL